jgi:hypothetical protein
MHYRRICFLLICGLNALNGIGQQAHGYHLEFKDYEFVKDTESWVAKLCGDIFFLGKLDSAGNFVPDNKYMGFKKGQPLSQVPPFRFINAEVQKGIYEYRSGRLIPGDIDERGNFVPALGGKVLDFKDYEYSPKAAKIYNLPGKFVKKEKKNERK